MGRGPTLGGPWRDPWSKAPSKTEFPPRSHWFPVNLDDPQLPWCLGKRPRDMPPSKTNQSTNKRLVWCLGWGLVVDFLGAGGSFVKKGGWKKLVHLWLVGCLLLDSPSERFSLFRALKGFLCCLFWDSLWGWCWNRFILGILRTFNLRLSEKKSTIVEFSYYWNVHWGFDPLKR